MANSKRQQDILNAKEAIENCIVRSRLIVFGNLPCYFYPIATGTDENGEHVIYAVFHRSVIEGAKRPGDVLPFDEMVKSGKIVLPVVYNIGVIYRTLRVTNRTGDFPTVILTEPDTFNIGRIHKASS